MVSRQVAPDVVVGESDDPVAQRQPGTAHRFLTFANIAYHIRDRTHVMAGAQAREHAEFALEWTAARRFQAQRREGLAGYQAEPRRPHAVGLVASRHVAGFQRAPRKIGIDRRHARFRIAHDDAVEEGLAQLRIGGRERPTVDRLGAAPAPVVRDLARSVEIGMQTGQEKQIVIA